MFEFAQTSERIKKDLSLCSMADNGAFGLEFYLISKKVDKRTQRLLKSGIELCKILQVNPEELEKSKTIPDRNQLISFEVHRFLRSSPDYTSTTELPLDISVKAKDYKKVLEEIINGKKYSEEKIREIQEFFESVEIPYLHKAKEGVEEFESHRKRRLIV